MTAFYRDPDAPVQPDQFAVEFGDLLNLYKRLNPRRVLEIGVREGGTLYQWMRHAEPGAQFTAVDIGIDPWWGGNMLDPIGWDSWAQSFGMGLKAIIGDSHAPATVWQVEEYAPFDFIFIDGDPSYS